MSDLMEPPVDVEQLSLRDYAEKAYLDYSMYVILDARYPMWVTDSNRCSAASFTR